MELNKLYNEDIFEFLNKLEDESMDLIIADPPYNQNIDKWDFFKNEKEYFEFMYKWLDLAIKKLKETGSIYLFNNAYNSAFILTHLVKKGLCFKNNIIWYKKDGFSGTRKKFVNNQESILFFTKSKKYTFNFNDIRMPYLSQDRMKTAISKGILKNGKRWFPNPNGKLCTDVWEITSTRLKNKIKGKVVKTEHPTPKPKEMIERIIKASSNQNDIVLDLFSGSGITIEVCTENNRNFISCENNEEYCKLIEKKLERLNDEK